MRKNYDFNYYETLDTDGIFDKGYKNDYVNWGLVSSNFCEYNATQFSKDASSLESCKLI